MKRTILLILLGAIVSMCFVTGCKDTLQSGPPTLEGDELVIASALRRHMYNHRDRVRYDYDYIFLSVFGEDPDRDFIEYFDDLFSQVRPGSDMKAGRYGFDGLPETKGVWVRFEVIDFEPVSDVEALVACQTFESGTENPAVRYRMQFLDGQWKATDIVGIEGQRILQ